MIQLELLSPAKNLECGIAAIDHGADAVYIGASRFGARAAAGNSTGDIKSLVEYAHRFGARVYATVNTILYDSELKDTERLIHVLYDIGVDALLVQDMSILKMGLPPIALHASTQTDNRTADKVKWLAGQGFSRVVLARELSKDEIAAIHEVNPDTQLEVFVHGALCVSYSGLCYASQYNFGRSANRGACAQFCRLKFDLVDSAGKTIEHDRYLLSLKDMCQVDNLEGLILAGACSFKIEGRLKDADYVKNVTAAYSEALNHIIRRYPDRYQRASFGRCEYSFQPNLAKTFNRGYTSYFFNGRQPDISSPDTPKAIGEFVGRVKEIRGRYFTVAGLSSFSNGDGLCFLTDDGLTGLRINRAEGNRLFPFRMPQDLKPGTKLYRNNDEEFQKILSKPSASRKIAISFFLSETDKGFLLRATTGYGHEACAEMETEKQKANNPQQDNIIRILGKLGNTRFSLSEVVFQPEDFDCFIPAARLTELRRSVCEALGNAISDGVGRNSHHEKNALSQQGANVYTRKYFYNSSNRLSHEFYKERGIDAGEAFELKSPELPLIMQCRYCIRYALGRCVKYGGKKPEWTEPLYLVNNGRYRLEFDCKNCKMNVYGEK